MNTSTPSNIFLLKRSIDLSLLRQGFAFCGRAFCIKYEMDRKMKSFYPDFLIIRKEGDGYVVDLLEPHNPAFNDNYAKTIGLYEYLKEEKGIARAEIIRKEDNRFLRLNVGDSMIQHDVMSMHSDDDLNNLFRKYNS